LGRRTHTNFIMNRIMTILGANVYKKYRIYERPI